MRWKWWIVAGAALIALLALVVAFLPMSTVLRRAAPGLEAEKVEGTVWDGKLRGAKYGDIPIGDVDAGLDFSRLFSGEASVRFKRLGPILSGRAGGTFEDRRLDKLTGELPLPILPQGLPPILLEFEDLTVHLGLRNNCLSAEGVVTASLPDIPGVGKLPSLSGTPRCEGDAIIVPLGASDNRFTLNLGLAPGGVWKAGLGIRIDNRVVVGVLEAIGFTATGDGVRTDSSGTVEDLQKLEQAFRAEIKRERKEAASLPADGLTEGAQ